jgi:hypothetical protein
VDFSDFSFSHFPSQYFCIESLTVIFHCCFVATVSSTVTHLVSVVHMCVAQLSAYLQLKVFMFSDGICSCLSTIRYSILSSS